MINLTGPGTPLDKAAFDAATARLGCDAPTLWALLHVETSGCGYQSDRRPKILFERHIFHRLTGGRYDAQTPDISQPTPGGYGAPGAHQYDRLVAALALDETAALSSASWGLGQIMGENHASAGYPTVQAMVSDFVASEGAQLAGVAAFIVASNLAGAVAAGNWAHYAQHYNGADYAKNQYDTRLATAHQSFVAHGCPDLAVRAAQVLLSYRAGYAPGLIDGILGDNTKSALTKFQAAKGLPQTGLPDETTLAELAKPED